MKQQESDLLQQAREQINQIDRQMADLFMRRMDACKQVATYKITHGKPIFDAAREKEVLAQNKNNICNPDYLPYYQTFLQCCMDLSKQYQKTLLSGSIIGFQGTEGAFSAIALDDIYSGCDIEAKAYPTFEAVFQALQQDDISAGVIPFENSYSGEVGEVLDLLLQYPCTISEVYHLAVDQNLLGLPGSSLDDIKIAYSKDQALAQSSDFLNAYGIMGIPYPNTALAAQFVSRQQDKTIGAIASAKTAQLYHLDILAEKINTSKQNTTRFIVIRKQEIGDGNRFSLLFTVDHMAGRLAQVMQTISAMGFNMVNIKSRPLKGKPWQYYFYVEISGSIQSQQAKQLLCLLEKDCRSLKVLGAYSI